VCYAHSGTPSPTGWAYGHQADGALRGAVDCEAGHPSGADQVIVFLYLSIYLFIYLWLLLIMYDHMFQSFEHCRQISSMWASKLYGTRTHSESATCWRELATIFLRSGLSWINRTREHAAVGLRLRHIGSASESEQNVGVRTLNATKAWAGEKVA
jgi:hypothetical protein